VLITFIIIIIINAVTADNLITTAIDKKATTMIIAMIIGLTIRKKAF
jgi:hypothetical protein